MKSLKRIKFLIPGFLFLALVVTPVFAVVTDDSSTTTSVVNNITLSINGDGIKWSVDGYSAKGFKVVWSKNSGPTYPLRSGDKYHYYTDPDKTEDTLTAFNGDGTYYVRVCEYLGGECGIYSNQIQVELGDSATKDEDTEDPIGLVTSILLSGDGSNIYWEVDGYSENGFKVVWSKNSEPTYPLRSGDKYHYYSDSSKDEDNLTAFNGNGTYYVRVCEYLGAKCGVYSNQIKLNLESNVVCTEEYSPVCGKDGRTYSNKCKATEVNGVKVAYDGECTKDEDIVEIESKTKLLAENKIDTILNELKELRDQVREQQSEITYLRGLLAGISEVTNAMQQSINNFITYGVDENTKKLGEGERAAVMYSYKDAYGKLPETEDELADAIKIANGRWPSNYNEEAEEEAKDKFETIYLRMPDMDNAQDAAAVKVMAYGLRQKAENRNLESEKNGINIFKGIFGSLPNSTEDWNIMQAITYSGATR